MIYMVIMLFYYIGGIMKYSSQGIWQIIMGAVCWGTLGILGSTLNYKGFSGSEVASLRIVIALGLLLLMLPYFWNWIKKIQLHQIPMLILQSLIGMLGMSICYFAAVASVGSSLAVSLLYTAPIWSLIFARLILGEHISKRSIGLTILAASGVGLVMFGGQAQIHFIGILFGLGSGVCYALYGVLGKRAMDDTTSPMLVFFTSVAVSAIVLLFLPNTHTAFIKLWYQPISIWMSAISLALIGTIIAFALFMKGLEKMPASRAAVFTIFEPLTAVVLASLILHEKLTIFQYLGIVLILLVTLLNTFNIQKRLFIVKADGV